MPEVDQVRIEGVEPRRSSDRMPSRSGALRPSLELVRRADPFVDGVDGLAGEHDQPVGPSRRPATGGPACEPGVVTILMPSDQLVIAAEPDDISPRESRSTRGSCGPCVCGDLPFARLDVDRAHPGMTSSDRRGRHADDSWRRRRRQPREMPASARASSIAPARPGGSRCVELRRCRTPRPVSNRRIAAPGGGSRKPMTTPCLIGARLGRSGEPERSELEWRDPRAVASCSCYDDRRVVIATAADHDERVAERAGFEPATGFPEPHFQCGAIVH